MALAFTPTLTDVAALLPWLPPELAQEYLDTWIESGDPTVALARVRSSPTYDVYFPGNRRPDGSLRYDEETYLSLKDAYRRAVAGVGVNPDLFEDGYQDMLEGEVSPSEFQARVDAIAARVLTRSDEARAIMANYGIEMDNAALIASVLDPAINMALINREITVADVGVAAGLRGFDIGFGTAEDLLERGFEGAAANQLFTQAQQLIPNLDELAARHLDPDDDFDLDEFLSAAVYQDPMQQRRIRRLVAQEQSMFAQQSRFRLGQGGVTGLVQS